MLPHRSTGQAVRVLRSFCLPTLLLLILPATAIAQDPASAAADTSLARHTKAPATETTTDGTTPSAVGPTKARLAEQVPSKEGTDAANPAPEPDTWMLLGTGAVVLLLLYCRRRARVFAARPIEP